MTITKADLRAKIAAAKKPKMRKAKQVWQPPTVDDFAYGSVLVFDQALSNTGVALVIHDDLGLRAINCINLVPDVEQRGHEGTMQRAFVLSEMLIQIRDHMDHITNAVIYEQPSVAGYRVESSLLAAFVLRQVWPGAHGIYNQHAKSILLGPGDHAKRDVRVAIEGLIPNWQRVGAWNQHVHDAVMLGLTYLYDRKKESRHD